MSYLDQENDTICALATPIGISAIAVVRISGADSLRIIGQHCLRLKFGQERKVVIGKFFDSKNPAEAIDEVVISFFPAGRSYTGEDTVEISCHGNPVIVQNILRELVKSGCRMAMPGEFTFRAFRSGRMDLVQAESVAALLETRSESGANLALRHLEGELSREIKGIVEDLLDFVTHLEVAIDLVEEAHTHGIRLERERLTKVRGQVRSLIDSYERGRLLKEGLRIGIVGRPNVGKSSIFNRLVGEERSIVTEIAGTTRDRVEALVDLMGCQVWLCDTAGLRDTCDLIETKGIEKGRQFMERADLLFFIFDARSSLTEDEKTEIQLFRERGKEVWIFGNKSDLGLSRKDCDFGVKGWISAQTGEGLEDIRRAVRDRFSITENENSSVVFNLRHYEGLRGVECCLNRAIEVLCCQGEDELISYELTEACRILHGLLGESFDEQVVDRIFGQFCVGK